MNIIETINKVDIAIISICRDLIILDINSKMKSVKEYSKELKISVGTIQKAFEYLEENEVIKILKNGPSGKILIKKNQKKIIELSKLNYILGVMPLPNSKRYEGLATGIKSSFEDNGIIFHFAYMQGSNIRLKMLKEGKYDIAVISNLAYQNINDKDIELLYNLGSNTYVNEHVLLKNKKIDKMKKIGIDKNSEDQYYLSKQYFEGKNVEFVEISSDKIIKKIYDKEIDAGILSIDEVDDISLNNLSIIHFDIEGKRLANEAVIVINKRNYVLRKLLKKIINPNYIISVQNKVIDDLVKPKY